MTRNTPILAALLLTFSTASAHAIGPELVQNGGFDTADNWTLGTSWQISPGPAPYQGLAFHNEGYTSNISQVLAYPLIAGATYRVTYTVTNAATSSDPRHWVLLRADAAYNYTPISTGAGTFTFDIKAPAGVHTISINAAYGCACVMDNFSIRELIP